MATLYPYQERVYHALMQGKNVILQAPTGAGKTRAALYPYFANLARYDERIVPSDVPLPWTCRYAVPMRVLATQFEQEFRDYFAKLDQTRGTDFIRRYQERLGVRLPAIQTGETPDDPQFEAPLTFCTIDQLLASFIGTPYSVSARQANINVGAVAGSYLILDEFHLYPLEHGNGARMTTLAMLQLLKNYSPFVMMTATFSSTLLQQLGTLLNAEIVRVGDQERAEDNRAELAEIMQGRRRTVQLSDVCMTPEAILAAHEQAKSHGVGASLVVCNTVARAQDMYLKLREALTQRGQRDTSNLELLHSRFTQTDRQTKSTKLEDWLGKEQWDQGHFLGAHDTIVVSTQVVEVGLNISCDVLHTELAPANSLIQRAGRCARFANQAGRVIVYPISANTKGNVSYRPYDDTATTATWDYLSGQSATHGNRPIPFGFPEEQALIDAVHTSDDQAMLATYQRQGQGIMDSVMQVLASHERGKEGELIRNVQQVAVVIHPTPQEAITTKPFTWQSFGLHPGTLAGAWEALEHRRSELGMAAPDWTLKELKFVGDALGADDDNDHQSHYTWDTLDLSDKKSAVQRLSATLRVALPPELATYDHELGFQLLLDDTLTTTGWQSCPVETYKKPYGDFSGKQGSYVEHISGLMRAYILSVRHELAWIAHRLETDLNLPSGSVDHALRLAIACHDIGKLSINWQRWAHAWQATLARNYGNGYGVAPERHWLAKTDRRTWREEQDLRKECNVPRPHHACESAIASDMFIGKRLAQDLTAAQGPGGLALTQATISAIVRHHAPLSAAYEAVAWDHSARDAIAEALRACQLPIATDDLNLRQQARGEINTHWMVVPHADSPTTITTTWLAFVLVRALRLCDQRAERV